MDFRMLHRGWMAEDGLAAEDWEDSSSLRPTICSQSKATLEKFASRGRNRIALKKSVIEERCVVLDYGSALGFLRTILRGVEERAISFHDVTTEYLRSEDKVWALSRAGGTVVFTREARDA